MISRNLIKWLCSLHLKKNRDKERLFLVEGEKVVKELLNSNYVVHSAYGLRNEYGANNFHEVDESTLKKISTQKTPHGVVALAHYKDTDVNSNSGAVLALNGVRDPGNMGTILRTAVWFGFDGVICSEDCVDIYHPKTVRASMGALFKLPIAQKNIVEELTTWDHSFALDMNGESLFEKDFEDRNVLFVLGNEANGLDDDMIQACSGSISLPGVGTQESLNVAMTATALCSEWFRRQELSKD